MQILRDTFLKSIKIMYGYKDIYASEPGRVGLIKRLSELPPWPVIDTISKLSVLIYNADPKELTQNLITTFLRPEAKLALARAVELNGNPDFVLLSDRSNALLLEFARRYCRSETQIEVNQNYLYQFGECFLLANDLATEAAFVGELGDRSLPLPELNRSIRKNYATFSTREILFNSSEQFGHTLARSNLIYDLLKSKVPSAHHFDLSFELEKLLDFSLNDYFLALLGIRSFWANDDLDRKNKDTHLDPMNVFPEGPNKIRFSRVLDHFSQDFIKEVDIPTELTEFHEWQYKYFDLRSAPLLRHQGRLYCSSMKFLTDLFWNGPYFLVLNKFKLKDREQFFHYLGAAIELYTTDLLKDALGKRVKLLKSAEGIPIGDCVIEMRSNWRVVVEVKSGRADTSLRSQAADPALSPKTAKMLFDGLDQLSARIAEMRVDGFTGLVTPVLVTAGTFPINSVVWDHYLEQCRDLSIFTDLKVHFPQVMDLKSVETLCAFMKAGARFGEILRAKVKPKWQKEDTKIFILENLGPQFKEAASHPVLRSLNSEIFNNLIQGLDLKGETPPVSEKNQDWRATFSL